MIRIGTHNVNGIRAALRRGFRGYWDETTADVVALQEVRCRVDDLPLEAFDGFHVTLDAGQLAGRNGVAILTRRAPERVRSLAAVVTEISPGGRPTDLSAERIVNRDLAAFSHEGRYVEVDLADAPVRVASLYLPKGAAWPYEEGTEEKYLRKMRFMRGLARAFSQARHHQRIAKTCDRTRIDAELAVIAERAASPGGDSRRREGHSADYRPAEEGLASLRLSRLVGRHADIGEISRRRRENYQRWTNALAGLPHCRPLFPQMPEGGIPYMFPLHIDRPDPHFYWLKHLGVPILRWDNIAASTYSTANDYRLRLLHLPCHQSLSERELEWMITSVRKIMARAAPGAT